MRKPDRRRRQPSIDEVQIACPKCGKRVMRGALHVHIDIKHGEKE